MKTGHRRTIVLTTLFGGLLALMLVAGAVLAAAPGISRSVIGSGEAVEASGMRLQSVIGQPVAGNVHSGLNLCSGYLCGPAGGGVYQVFLPLVLRH